MVGLRGGVRGRCALLPSRGKIFLLVCLLYEIVALNSFNFRSGYPLSPNVVFFFKAEGEFCLEVGYRNLAPRCREARDSLLRPSVEFANTRGTYRP